MDNGTLEEKIDEAIVAVALRMKEKDIRNERAADITLATAETCKEIIRSHRCGWNRQHDSDWPYSTSCGQITALDPRELIYCPYCQGTIEED